MTSTQAPTPPLAGIAHQLQGQATINYLKLEEVKVRAWVVDVSSRIVLAQTFYNPSDEATGRAKYVFPLPATAAVCAFELELEDGSVIIGEVKEKEDAALNFTRAVEQGRSAALVERVTDDIFTISVGSIPAKTRVIAHLTFIMDLLDEAVTDHVRLQLPMYIAERYGTPPVAMVNTSAADSRTRVDIIVDIQTSDIIHDIQSPTHAIKRRRYKGHSDQISQRRMSVIWKSSEFLTDDFVVTIHAEGLDKPRCFAELLDARRDGDGERSTIAMQLTLVPKFQAPKIPSQEYIFIIDRSGSMDNAPIETAKRTLTMLLHLLPYKHTTFNIFSFGSNVTSLWPSSRNLNRNTLVESTTHVAGMSANYGGTEIPNALQNAFQSRSFDRPAVVFLLTDGQVHNPLNAYAVISNAVQGSSPQAPMRLFVLGIGTGVSSDVCNRLAEQGNGQYFFALAAEEILGKCACLLSAGRSKNIERIEIDWGNDTSSSSPQATSPPMMLNLSAGIPELAPPPPVQQAPHALTRIFSGIRFTVLAITTFRTIPTTIRLTTTLEGIPEPQQLDVDVTRVKPFRDTHNCSTVPIVHTMAARKLIMELDNRNGPLPIPAPGDALVASEDDLRKAGIIRLGLTYQLVSEHTSFVAIQKGDERMRNRGRGSGSMAWARSRLRQSQVDTRQDHDSPAASPTFFDDIVSGVSTVISSVFGLFRSSTTTTSTFTTMTTTAFISRHQFPGAYDGSDSDTSARSRGRRPRRGASPRRGRSTSRASANSYSTMSSLESSSTCSSCWTSSRPPSPLPPVGDSIDRAPSPTFVLRQDTNVPAAQLGGAPRHRPRVAISQEVYELFRQMDVDGSSPVSPLLQRLVGDAVLGEATTLGIDAKVWATVVVVAYMRVRLQGEPDLLELVSEKAREFVQAAADARGGGGHAMGFDEMVRRASALLNAKANA